MRKQVLLMLLIFALGPFYGVASNQSTPAAEVESCASDVAQASPAPEFNVDQSTQARDKTPASSCGPNFCTQAQQTQCAQSCRHHPFVGLECDFTTCTSFCNCGSVPTGF